MTTTDTTVNDLVINVLTKAQYDAIPNKSNTELYMVTDDITMNNTIKIERDANSSNSNIARFFVGSGALATNIDLYGVPGSNLSGGARLVCTHVLEAATPGTFSSDNSLATLSWVKSHAYKPIVDYSSGITPTHPTSSSKFTAPSDGIFVDCFYYGTDNINYLYINSKKTNIVNITASSNRNNRCSVIVPLAQGDEIYWDCGSTNTYAIGFYPYLYNSV